MVKLDDVPGLEVWVTVDGKRAEEYWNPKDEVETTPKACRRYIEGIPGKSFQVHAHWSSQFKPKRYRQKVELTIDGIPSLYFVISPKCLKSEDCFHDFYGFENYRKNGENTLSRLTFRPLNITRRDEPVDPEEMAEFEDKLRDVGKLVWTCQPVTGATVKMPTASFDEDDDNELAYNGDDIPPEVAHLMQISQSVGHVILENAIFGTPEVVWLDSEGEEEVRQMQTKTLILSPVKGVKGPFPTITFCYRNQEQLQHMKRCSLESPSKAPRRVAKMTKEASGAELQELGHTPLDKPQSGTASTNLSCDVYASTSNSEELEEPQEEVYEDHDGDPTETFDDSIWGIPLSEETHRDKLDHEDEVIGSGNNNPNNDYPLAAQLEIFTRNALNAARAAPMVTDSNAENDDHDSISSKSTAELNAEAEELECEELEAQRLEKRKQLEGRVREARKRKAERQRGVQKFRREFEMSRDFVDLSDD